MNINKNDAYLFIKACKDGDVRTVNTLLAQGMVNVNTTSHCFDNLPALIISYSNKHKDIIEILLANKANPDIILIDACINGEENIVELLIQNSANIHAQDVYGMTPLMYSCKFGKKNIVELLIEQKVNIHVKDIHGVNVLMYSIQGNNKEIIELLLGKNLSLHETDNESKTILMFAAEKGNKEIIKLLIAKGVDVNAKDKYGVTAIMIADIYGHKEIVELLIENKAQISNNYYNILSTKKNQICCTQGWHSNYYHRFPFCLTSELTGWNINPSNKPIIKGNIDRNLLEWLNRIFGNCLRWDGGIDVKWIKQTTFKGAFLTFVANSKNSKKYIIDYYLQKLQYIKNLETLYHLDPERFSYTNIDYYSSTRPIDILKYFFHKIMIMLLNSKIPYDKEAYQLAIDLWLEPGFNSRKTIEELYQYKNSFNYYRLHELQRLGISVSDMNKLGKILNTIGDLGLALLPGGFDRIREKFGYFDGNGTSVWIRTDAYLYAITSDWH